MDAHKVTDKLGIKNENCRQGESNKCMDVIGSDPNVKSMLEKFPPRTLLSEEVMKLSYNLQILLTIDKKHLFSFSQNVSQLKKFECPPNFNDEDLIKLIPHFRHLSVLKFFKCKNISDKSLVHLSKNWPEDRPRLKELIVYECNKVTDEGVESLLSSCNSIKILFLSSNKLTARSFHFIGRTCGEIRKLTLGITGDIWHKNINKIQNVTDDGIRTISEGCKQLRQLNLNHCVNVTDLSLQHLANNSKDLEVLHIFACHQISVSGLVEGLTRREENNFSSLINITVDSKVKELWKKHQYAISKNKIKTKLCTPAEPPNVASYSNLNWSFTKFQKAISSF